MRAYVTTSGNLGLWLDADAPLPIHEMLEGKVRRGVINVAIPLNVQEPVVGRVLRDPRTSTSRSTAARR